MMRWTQFCALIALLASPTAPASAPAEPIKPGRCAVPVVNGTPTAADVGATWRMVFKVVSLPGIARPVLYPLNRGGVWTIDEEDSYVPFGGEFPSNSILDSCELNPETGRILGVNPFRGVFLIEPGERAFRQVSAAGGGSPLRHPSGATYVPRFGAFDANSPKARMCSLWPETAESP